MRDVVSTESLGRLREWRDTINQNFIDVFNELRYIIAREDELVTYTTATESVTSSTTLQNDDELFLPVKANARYHLQLGVLVAQAATGVGITYGFTYPTGTTIDGVLTHGANIATNFSEAGGSITGANLNGNSTSDVWLMFSGSVTVGTTKGVLQFQFAQQSSSVSAISRKASSFLRMDRLDR